MSEVHAAVPGSLRVLIVDTTDDRNKFEHATTRQIHANLKASGVDVLEPVFVNTIPALTDAVQQADFTALLWVAHGGPPDGDRVATIAIGRATVPWQLVGTSGLELPSKLVALCVCSSGNADMTVSLQASEVFALATVAPTVTLSAREAVAFFPTFFARLKPVSVATIEPELIRELVVATTSLAGGKMVYFGP